MPFLRVIRDKRGYETTYLMHWYREGHKQRSRILYVFRTPGGVRVGRGPMEPDVRREIEREYPDIDFDWTVVVENQQVIETAPEQRRPRKRRREDEAEPAAERAPDKARPEAAAPPAQTPPRPPVPATIEGATPDEQMGFLAQWYPQIRERVMLRASDPARQEALLAMVERLNPAGWTDADQITTGLQQAAEALERLARVLAKRRRRSRKGKKGTVPGAEPAGTPESAAAAGDDESDGADADEPPDIPPDA